MWVWYINPFSLKVFYLTSLSRWALILFFTPISAIWLALTVFPIPPEWEKLWGPIRTLLVFPRAPVFRLLSVQTSSSLMSSIKKEYLQFSKELHYSCWEMNPGHPDGSQECYPHCIYFCSNSYNFLLYLIPRCTADVLLMTKRRVQQIDVLWLKYIK